MVIAGNEVFKLYERKILKSHVCQGVGRKRGRKMRVIFYLGGELCTFSSLSFISPSFWTLHANYELLFSPCVFFASCVRRLLVLLVIYCCLHDGCSDCLSPAHARFSNGASWFLAASEGGL